MKPFFLLLAFLSLCVGSKAQCYNAFLQEGDKLASKRTVQGYKDAVEMWKKAKKEPKDGGCAPLTAEQVDELSRRINSANANMNDLIRADANRRFEEAKNGGIPSLREYIANCSSAYCRIDDARRELERLEKGQNELDLIPKARNAQDPTEKKRLYEQLKNSNNPSYRDEANRELRKLTEAQHDETLLQNARKSQKKEDFQRYLDSCKICQKRQEAINWLRDREKTEADSIDWKTTTDADVLDAYRTYKRKQPQGKWVSLANDKIRILEQVALYNPDLVAFDGGEYQMGNIEINEVLLSNLPNEEAHKVCLKGFFIARTELPFSIYDLYCEDTGQTSPSDKNWGRGQQPAINVSWYDAVRFCNWLSRRKNLRPYYRIEQQGDKKFEVSIPDRDADGYRLPTEAEWEYAAGISGKTKYFFGTGENEATSSAINFNPDSDKRLIRPGTSSLYRQRTVPVSDLKANLCGLYHMSGNVREWCWDMYAENYGRVNGNRCEDNPIGASNALERVAKGGGWMHNALQCRVSARAKHRPETASDMLGFRIAKNR